MGPPMKYVILFFMFLLASMPVHAEDAKETSTAKSEVAESAPTETTPAPVVSTLEVKDAYAFATAPDQTAGAIFFTIANSSSTADKLTSVSTDAAASAELHTNMIEEDAVTMIKVDGYDIRAGETLKLEPSGHHVMLTGLTKPLKEGDVFPATLIFAKKGGVTIEVTVKSPVEQMDHMDHDAHAGHDMENSAGTLDTSGAPTAPRKEAAPIQ